MKNKKVVYTIIGIIALVLVALAITYAYWQITKTQEGVNEITTACLDITLVDAEEGNTGVSLLEQYPISDTEGAELTPYKFTVTNNCDTEVDYQIALESTGDSTTSISQGAIKVMLDDEAAYVLSDMPSLVTTISGAYASNKLGMGTLAAIGEEGSSATHELRLWIDEDAPVEENNKSYTGKITVTIGQGIVNPPIKEGMLAYKAIQTYGGFEAISSRTDFTEVTVDGEFAMHSALDDGGTSYYYRGDVPNNYVQFGEWQSDTTVNNGRGEEMYSVSAGTPMYWRIIRINSNGTIRMIYDGTTLAENGVEHNGEIAYQSYSSGDSTFNESNIPAVLNNWYTTHLETNYNSFIADEIFCDDREITDIDEEFDYITYAPNSRLHINVNPNVSPILTCTRDEDKLTVANVKLSKPIGLITAYEVAMAGAVFFRTNTSFYLNDGGYWWTMSSSVWNGSGSEKYQIAFDSDVFGGKYSAEPYGVRPVINLKADVDFTYNSDDTAGTISDPYVITTN